MINLNEKERIEAEQGVIGSIIIDQRVIPEIASKLTPDDFINPVCALMFESAVDASERGKTFDPIVAVDIAGTKLGEDAAKFVFDLVQMTPTAANATIYADIVKKHSGLRYLRDNAMRILENDDPQVLSGDLISLCQEFLQTNRTKRIKSISDALMAFYEAKTNKEPAHRIDTGLSKLDSKLKGFHEGDLIIIAARPGIGKTALAIQLAKYAAAQGNRTHFFSLEMTETQIVERLISRYGVSMDKLIDNNFTEQDWSDIGAACSSLSNLPLDILDEPKVSVPIIRAIAQSISDLKYIVIDYLQLMQAHTKRDRNDLLIGDITRDLKILAKELRIPILLLSQLNREKSSTQKPTLRELRDSGAIEQDADKVIMLWQLDENPPEDIPIRIGCTIEKNRRGKKGIDVLMFDGAHMTFTETEERYEPPDQKARRRFDLND